ncbi:MAG: hypothetical protein JNL73_12425 [Anaerolineales bacterium]|nr:hypothetical protein [Anaerolineales bacterium]
MPHDYLLGVDGGGTQTTALVADGAGRVLGRGGAGSSNLHAAGEAAAMTALEAAISEACLAAGIARGDLRAACLGLAGAARPADQARLRAWAAQVLPAVRLVLVTDAELALAAGTSHGRGVALTGRARAPGAGVGRSAMRAVGSPSGWVRCGLWCVPPMAARPRPRCAQPSLRNGRCRAPRRWLPPSIVHRSRGLRSQRWRRLSRRSRRPAMLLPACSSRRPGASWLLASSALPGP